MHDKPLPTVEDHLTRPRLLLKPEDDVLDGIKALVEKEITAGMVVDGDHKLVGILTVTDSLRAVSAAAYRGETHGGPVSAFMSPVRVILRPEMDLFEAAREFLSCHVQTLPVLAKDGRLLGRLTRHALLSAIQHFAASQEDARVQLEKAGRADGASRPTSIEEMQKRAASHGRQNLVKFFSRSG